MWTDTDQAILWWAETRVKMRGAKGRHPSKDQVQVDGGRGSSVERVLCLIADIDKAVDAARECRPRGQASPGDCVDAYISHMTGTRRARLARELNMSPRTVDRRIADGRWYVAMSLENRRILTARAA